jgi:putative transcriptional regulator
MFCTKQNPLLKTETMKNTIRVERAIKNITQAELAGKIKVSRQTINAIESNKYVPSTVLALKMAKLFGKKVEEIFILEEND